MTANKSRSIVVFRVYTKQGMTYSGYYRCDREEADGM